jgi:putative transcriptional regulator
VIESGERDLKLRRAGDHVGDWAVDSRRMPVPGRPIRMGTTVSPPSIVNRIRERRQSVDVMTQEKLGALCGVTRQTIIALEAGKYSPSLELAFKISYAVGYRLDEVFQWSVKK